MVRRYIKYLVIVVAAFVVLSPRALVASTGDDLLRELSNNISKLGCYEVSFSIEMTAQHREVTGRYIVDEHRYSLDMSGLRIYGDAKTRYSIDAENHEVVIERLDGSIPMLILNPALAFIALDRHFDARVIAKQEASDHSEELIVLELKPKSNIASSLEIDSSVLALDGLTKLPSSIGYMVDGEIIRIKVNSIMQSDMTIPPFDSIDYPAEYEIIDLR